MVSPILKQMFVVSGAILNDLTTGLIHGYPAVLLQQGKDNVGDFVIDAHLVATFASVLPISGTMGCLAAPFLINKFGRRLTHLSTTFPFMAGWMMAAFATNPYMLYGARLFQGLGLGLRAASSGILVAEYSDRRYRGAFLGFFAISLGLGVFFSHLIGHYLHWKTCALLFTVIPMIAMIIIFFSPESPHWLATQGNYEKCRENFVWLRGDDSKNLLEVENLIESQKVQRKIQTSFNWKLLKTRIFLIPALIALNVEILQEFGGSHILPAYGNLILTNVLKKSDVSLEFTALDMIRILAAFPGLIVVKKVKRKSILLFGCMTTIICFFFISLYAYLVNHGYMNSYNSLPMALFVIYSIIYCMCVLPLIPVLCNEIFPLSVRSMGSAFTAVILGPLLTITLKTAPLLFESLGIDGAYLMYAIILTVSLFIILTFVPETKDKTLQEIETHFTKKHDIKKETLSQLIIAPTKDKDNIDENNL